MLGSISFHNWRTLPSYHFAIAPSVVQLTRMLNPEVLARKHFFSLSVATCVYTPGQNKHFINTHDLINTSKLPTFVFMILQYDPFQSSCLLLSPLTIHELMFLFDRRVIHRLFPRLINQDFNKSPIHKKCRIQRPSKNLNMNPNGCLYLWNFILWNGQC